nr:helix-turn-helix transcriptional regulator [uncultured Anaerobutyricum sp.]
MFSDKIRELMIEKDISLPDLATLSGVPFETLRNIYYRKVKDPKVSTAFQLASALGVTVEYLLSDTNKEEELEDAEEQENIEEEILENYRECGNHGRAIIRIVARFESKAARKERLNLHKMKHRIPCLIPVGRVGDGIDYNSCTVEDEYTMIKKVYLAIEITNNNFAPAYCKGDRILLENRFPELGERAVFTDGVKAYFRYFKMEGDKYCLKCLNGRGEDILLRRMDEVDCLGTCISVIRR